MKRTRAIKLIDTNGRTNCHVVHLTLKSLIKLYFRLRFKIYNLVTRWTWRNKRVGKRRWICTMFPLELFLSVAMLSPIKRVSKYMYIIEAPKIKKYKSTCVHSRELVSKLICYS